MEEGGGGDRTGRIFFWRFWIIFLKLFVVVASIIIFFPKKAETRITFKRRGQRREGEKRGVFFFSFFNVAKAKYNINNNNEVICKHLQLSCVLGKWNTTQQLITKRYTLIISLLHFIHFYGNCSVFFFIFKFFFLSSNVV